MHIKKNGQVEGETIFKAEGTDIPNLLLAKLQYVTNVCINFQKNHSKTVEFTTQNYLTSIYVKKIG